MRRITALLLTLTLLLSGCASMLEQDHLVVSPHVNQVVIADDPSVLRAKNYQELVNGVLYFVSRGMDSGTIRLTKYSGDPELDLASACAEVQQEDPLGAYALERLEYSCSLIVSYYECSFSLTYRRTQAQMDALRTVSGSSSIREELKQAVETRQAQIALRISSYYAREDTLQSLLREACLELALENVACTMELTFYPAQGGGTQRIVELTFSYAPVEPGSQEPPADPETREAQAADLPPAP